MNRNFFRYLALALVLGSPTIAGATTTDDATTQNCYRNPVVSGFHPDPSVCLVGDDFYMVCSSFQYFPGVPVMHSRDLVHWQQIGNVLTRDEQLPLKDASSWLGIYAPTLRYHDGTFYLITTNVGNGGNFLVTATRPEGPWSNPVWLSQQGIDPSLYFEDGHCYMVSNPNDGIWLCEIDPATGKQLTESRMIWQGDGGRYPEGPHIYKKDGYYYLLISEGGTELAHHLTIARSRNIAGPYESNPNNPILTNCNRKGQTMQIQGTGHGDLVQAGDGSWWMAFLAYRNFGGSYHHLGRETCVVPVEWKDGEWPVVNGSLPVDTLTCAPRLLPSVPMEHHLEATAFAPTTGKYEWVYIQNPIRKNYEWTASKLRLRPNGTLTENRQPTFVGRRQESGRMLVETEVKVNDAVAGLSIHQIHDGHIDLVASPGKVAVRLRLKSIGYEAASAPVIAGKNVRLRITSDGEMYRFFFSADGKEYKELTAQNCSLMSTEVAGGFTGVVIGMFAEGKDPGAWADFSYFKYE